MKPVIVNGGSKNGYKQKTAKIVGVLFIIGTAAGIMSLLTAGYIVHAPDYQLRYWNLTAPTSRTRNGFGGLADYKGFQN